MLQQNRAEKIGGRGRGKKIPSGTVVTKEIPQEEQLPCTLQECNNMAESSKDESNEEGDDGTTCKTCEIPKRELTDNVESGFNATYAINISVIRDDDFFVVFASDLKY